MNRKHVAWGLSLTILFDLYGESATMIKQRIRSSIPKKLIQTAYPLIMKRAAKKCGLTLRVHGSFLEVFQNDRMIRISCEHAAYLNDIFQSFDYYYTAVEPFSSNGFKIVDYSDPRYHDVVGFDLCPIMFPSFAEPFITASQYLEFANLSEGMTVIDLGAYSGLTSIVFSQAVGHLGTVIAIDADPTNLHCVHININRYNRLSASSIRVMEGAVWNNSNGIEFSSEGNMGGSASFIVGENRGHVIKVRTFTLSDVAALNGVSNVDFIKCDIEGAEAVVFEDKEFFNRFRPRIIVEPHIVKGRSTSDKVIADLSGYRYKCRSIRQKGVELPLIECVP